VFDECSDIYMREDKHWGGDLDIIREYAEKFTELSILDVGTGLAWHLVNLLLMLSPSVKIEKAIGLDYSDRMLQKASDLLESYNFNNKPMMRYIQLQHGDVLELPFNDTSFNMVLCLNNTLGNIKGSNVMDPVIYRKKELKEINRVLKPDGFFVLSVYNANALDLKESYGDVFELHTSQCNLRNFDLVIRFKKTNTLYYSHWFKYQEIKKLLANNHFSLLEKEKRKARMVIVCQKFKNQS